MEFGSWNLFSLIFIWFYYTKYFYNWFCVGNNKEFYIEKLGLVHLGMNQFTLYIALIKSAIYATGDQCKISCTTAILNSKSIRA